MKSVLDYYYQNNPHYYTSETLPMTIGNAIYNYGDNSIRSIVGYIDLTDGTNGLIFTDNTMYFNLNIKGSVQYKDISTLIFHKNKDYTSVQINNYIIDNQYINPDILIHVLNEICEIDIQYKMSDTDKIVYFTEIMINDIFNDQYEDVELTSQQHKALSDLKDELEYAKTLKDIDYSNELESVCKHAVNLFDELELDSEELDQLIEVNTRIETQHEETLNKAKDFYDDVMNQYSNGNTQMYDQLKGMMSMMGISEDDLKGKSMDEIEDLLCSKFNISKEMMNSLKKRMGM